MLELLFDILHDVIWCRVDKVVQNFLNFLRMAIPFRKKISERTWRALAAGLSFLTLVLATVLLAGIYLLIKHNGRSVFGWVAVGLNVLYLLTGAILTLRYK